MCVITEVSKLVEKYPSTRYMGSKRKVLTFIHEVLADVEYDTCLDAFAGSGIVSYYFKSLGKQVFSNDFMHFPSAYSKAAIENNTHTVSEEQLKMLLSDNPARQTFIGETFKGLYFTDEENAFLDNVRSNIGLLPNDYLKAIALSALVRTCLKKRPRGIFTYVGQKYNDGRKDLQLSMREHFIENIRFFNEAVFDNGRQNVSLNASIFDLQLDVVPDLVYLDPPYYNPKSDNDYTRRYHFVEGLVRNWDGLDIQKHTRTKKFRKYSTPFDHKTKVHDAFRQVFRKFRDSILVVSYSSNSMPNKEEMVELLSEVKDTVEIHELDYLYSVGNHGHKVNDNSNRVKEYIFIAR